MIDTDDYVQGRTPPLSRVTVRFPKPMVDQLDQLVDQGMFPNRSEAIRASVRDLNNNPISVGNGGHDSTDQ